MAEVIFEVHRQAGDALRSGLLVEDGLQTAAARALSAHSALWPVCEVLQAPRRLVDGQP